MPKKSRLDQLLVGRGLFPSREQARRAILAGEISVASRLADKPSELLDEQTAIAVKPTRKYVGRGALKLESALDYFCIDLQGKTALDIGASTGGFTDCMLQRGAKKIYAVDVGYGQLDWKLRNDSRVIVLEKINARFLADEQVSEPIDICAVDVSFISLTLILPNAFALLKPRGVILALIKAIAKEFQRFSISTLFEKATARVAGKQLGYPMAELGAMTDLLVVAGGDGSILRVIGQLGETIKPIFGINVGSLGFLTCVSSSNYREAVECIAKDRINFSHRALLEARVTLGDKRTNKMLALNDAVLSRGELSRLVMLRTRVNGESLTEFNADGLVVATPTGSTAYSLSAGGPILDPESGVFVITPICPHVLTNRSIIVADGSIIEIEASHPDYPVYLTLDGRRPIHVERGSIVTVRKAKKTLPLASLPDASFFSVVRQKLKWSGSNV